MTLHSFARSAVRRVDVLDRAVARAADRRRRVDRLTRMYDRLRRRYSGVGTAVDLPSVADIAAVETAVLQGGSGDAFLRGLVETGDVEWAAVDAVRGLLRNGGIGRARTVAQAFQLRMRPAGDVAKALIALHDREIDKAWTTMRAHSPKFALRVAPAEYLRAGFGVAPVIAGELLDDLLREATGPRLGPLGWLDIARTSFAAGFEDLSVQALDRAEALADTGPARRVRSEAAWLRRWYGRAGAVVQADAGEIPFAVLDYKSPDRARSSINLGDPVQTLASLGHLLRRSGVRFTGERDLVQVVDELRTHVRPERAIDGPPANVRLYPVDRDASSYAAIPNGTWMLAFGWYMHSQFGARYDLPFDARLRPIFISFHVNNPLLLTPPVLSQLRRCGPVGCRDWNTVHLLHAAGVPAFFSGCITTTIDTLFPPDPAASPEGTLYVDTPASGSGEVFTQEFDAVRARSLAENLRDAARRVRGYRDTYSRVVASRLHCYLPARSIGADVEFRPKNPANVRFDGLAGISDLEFAAMRTGILDKLATVFDVILSGASESDVYAVWRDACAADVAAAGARRAAVPPMPATRFDVAAACRSVLDRSVTVARSRPGPAGREIDVEFSLDGNLKHQLAVVLESIVTRASRPVRAFVLCRDHGPDDFARLAALFPTVTFVWLPTDEVDYGPLSGMIGHITVATMDRLLLPDLLPDVARIVHHDVDALCLTDLASLYDIDLAGCAIAARTSPHPDFLSGFREFVRVAVRLPDAALARDFVLRTHTRHRYDFDVFNAGIMVLDLDRMRADGFSRDFLPYVARYGMNDQAVLNAYTGADRLALDPGWNWHPRLELPDELPGPAKIAHWAGPLKPWGPAWVNGKDLWQDAERQLAARLAG